ncbi:hypothetical protein EI42_05016 [Thermosporothrix hazakensis]|jgi:hypothetical protein|uniref:Uncharacterized protein n=2 Tax=Thermosporothrix TaxID=768650 RepID=A0A326U0Z8_THEHA|nr:hypothetical protein [Thermosporothrix hazakensis]PZW23394.1 hypothetical protein EI42_05016 [Thermosporothrix hazakensis]BBH89739.1 hypothetical protein KTC_44900 [Thermosporothrix sp. COM3]GCE47928.1 hypothetical protein KTH_27970 [Thermosporothrix hazakensis]
MKLRHGGFTLVQKPNGDMAIAALIRDEHDQVVAILFEPSLAEVVVLAPLFREAAALIESLVQAGKLTPHLEGRAKEIVSRLAIARQFYTEPPQATTPAQE